MIDGYFHITKRGSTIGREVKAGVVTFLTMSYILIVNPQILGVAGLPVEAVAAATALTAALSSLLCGLLANMPVGVSPGMGVNAYFVFSQVLGHGVSINKALACCLTAAGVVVLLALGHALTVVLAIVPNSIKLAVVVGMGLLLSFIGLHTSGIVVPDARTMVAMGDPFALEPMLAIGGLALIAALHYRNVRGSIIIGVLVTAIGYYVATASWPTQFLALPRLQLFRPDFSELFTREHVNAGAWSSVLAYTLVIVFDIAGAVFGLGNLAGLLEGGHVPGAAFVYLSAAAGTAVGALTGTTPLIVAAESAVGIKEGGRTGLTALTVSGCFAASMFLSPFLKAIPQVATAPVLVLVGAMMMGECTHIDWSSMLSAVPAFLTIVIQPFTFSIANGIYAGLAMSLLLFLLTGQFLEVLPGLRHRKWVVGGSQGAPGDAGAADLEARLLLPAGSPRYHDGGRGGSVRSGSSSGMGTPRAGTPRAGTPRQGRGRQHGSAGAGGIPIGGSSTPRGGSGQLTPREVAASLVSSLGSLHGPGTSYERTSFDMYLNTRGSGGKRRPRSGSSTRPGSSGNHSLHGSEGFPEPH
ncbi:hypothetical protein N2152v2_002965 [Parachlorella kessleri]